MESISAILRRSTTSPNESTRPDPAPCEVCGRVRAPVWNPLFGRWAMSTLCDRCHDRETEEPKPVPTIGPAHMTFDAFEPETDSQKAALEVVQGGGSVWLWGSPGTGKTHLAVAAAKIGEGTVRFENVPDLLGRLRTAAVEGDVEAMIADLRSASLVVFDDIGVERPTPFAVECLYRIVDSRYTAGRRVIVTSNVPPSKVAATLGARTHSRLRGMCKVVNVIAPDRRTR